MEKKIVSKPLLLLFLGISLLYISCSKDDDGQTGTKTQFGIFKVINDTSVELNGTINSASLNNFNALIKAYPNVRTINMVNCDGSSDDEVNLRLSKLVYDRETSIHINDNGSIASGGTDFFLAGTSRTKGNNTRIGVHSWSDGSNEATDFAVGHANHLPYINYYVSIGFTQEQAEAFYYFTINAAPASSIHWMTDAEIEQYNMLK